MKILLVEDEPKVGRFVERGLRESGFTVLWVTTGAAASDALAETAWDLVILDLGLPDGDGLDLLASWRASRFVETVLILSARDAVGDRVKGLDLGADDYLSKPFSFEELVARVRSLLRRRTGARSTVLRHRGIELDLLARTATVDGRAVELTGREFSLLEYFLHHPGQVLTRTQIAEAVWEADLGLDTNLIDVYLRRLRQKLDPQGGKELFRTVRGTGYALDGP